jgi:hypothetical protein
MAGALAFQISIAREDLGRIPRVCVHADEIAEMLISELGEVRSGVAIRVGGTAKRLGRDDLRADRKEVPVGKVELTRNAQSVLDELKRTTFPAGDSHGEPVVVIVGEGVKRHAHLAQLADAANTPGPGVTFANAREKQGSEDPDDRHDAQELHESEGAGARGPGRVHTFDS